MSKVAPLAQITAGIRAVQEREQKETLKLLESAKKRAESRKYNCVELGWQLLRLKEVTAHGNAGNQHAAKNKSDTVTLLFCGFEEGVQSEFGIEPRTAQRYMNAARNAGLSAESKPSDIALLRKKKALVNTPLAKLYRNPDGEAQPETSLADQMQARRIMAEMKLMAGRGALLNRIHEEILQEALFSSLSPDQIERLYHKLAEATDKVAEHRPNARRKAA